MKKILWIFYAVCFFAYNSYADDFTNFCGIPNVLYKDDIAYIIKGDGYICEFKEQRDDAYCEIFPILMENEHGFLKDKLNGLFILEAKGLILYHHEKLEKALKIYGVTEWLDMQRKLFHEGLYKHDEYTLESAVELFGTQEKDSKRLRLGDTVFFNTGILKITSSSYFIEAHQGKEIVYSPEYFLSKIFYNIGDDYINFWLYDSVSPPWVEGVKGYGIGEYLDIDFKYASDEIQILNGFVDFSRKHLYRANSRVKKILVESDDPKFAKEYELEDVVRYTPVRLPEKTKKIRITIKDVYKGDKYDDTCISSITVTDPNVPSFEERKKQLLKLLEATDVMKKIKTFKEKSNMN
ncbi:hypothetical protein IZU27_07835 [Treponema socranskii]|uniref:NADase-type glycan-binding domain-containing protein n=1 Tax=Treponema socranskii TaxID=53419 RepID=UPI003D9105E0